MTQPVRVKRYLSSTAHRHAKMPRPRAPPRRRSGFGAREANARKDAVERAANAADAERDAGVAAANAALTLQTHMLSNRANGERKVIGALSAIKADWVRYASG